MRQTAALLLDAYRELNSRRLFWLTLLLSGVVVGAFGLVGINDKGLRIAFWDVETVLFNTNVLSRETFYKMLFFNLGIGFWLTWLATILALISTAGIFPDFLAGGAIELTLSKPISRVRLFLTKYVAALLFVALQVLVFAAGSFFVIGLRGSVWEPGVFLAVPIVVVFFSYLFSICVLLGVITRSTIASLLITLVIWFVIAMLGNVETLILTLKTGAERDLAMKQSLVDGTAARLERAKQAVDAEGAAAQIIETQAELEQKQKDRDDAQSAQRTFERIYGALYTAKTLLPKTKDTTELLDRALIADADLEAFLERQTSQAPRRRSERGSSRSNRDRSDEDVPEFARGMDDPEAALEAQRRVRNRPLWWVLGTSLAFEAAVLGLASWIFVRRDF